MMNERIKQLSIQAGFPEWSNHAIEFELEQFAELIVNECYQKLVDMDQQVKASHNYYKHAAIQIKLHFGIEP
jgi:hypothetical protein